MLKLYPSRSNKSKHFQTKSKISWKSGVEWTSCNYDVFFIFRFLHFESVGRRFESCRAYHKNHRVIIHCYRPIVFSWYWACSSKSAKKLKHDILESLNITKTNGYCSFPFANPYKISMIDVVPDGEIKGECNFVGCDDAIWTFFGFCWLGLNWLGADCWEPHKNWTCQAFNSL